MWWLRGSPSTRSGAGGGGRGPDSRGTSFQPTRPSILDLWTALGQLSRQERVVIVLAVIGGYTQAEIAGHLGVPVGTVSSWSTRGRQRLRIALSNEEGTNGSGH